MYFCTSASLTIDLIRTRSQVPDPYGHHINLKSLKTSMTLKFEIILQYLIKAYHRKSGKSKYDRKLVRVNGVLVQKQLNMTTLFYNKCQSAPSQF